MSKKINIGMRPTNVKEEINADAWVESRNTQENEPMKRLTIDVPESLHREIKAQCARRGTKIADEVRELLLNKYRNN